MHAYFPPADAAAPAAAGAAAFRQLRDAIATLLELHPKGLRRRESSETCPRDPALRDRSPRDTPSPRPKREGPCEMLRETLSAPSSWYVPQTQLG